MAPKNKKSPPRKAASSRMTRHVFTFTNGFPLAKAGRKAGADRCEEHSGAVMGPEQASADECDGDQRAGDEQRPRNSRSCDDLRHGGYPARFRWAGIDIATTAKSTAIAAVP